MLFIRIYLKEELPVNNIGGQSWYLECAFERDKMEGVVKMTQTAFVDSLVDRFGIQYEAQTPASVEFDLGPQKNDEKKGDWPYKQAVGGFVVDLGDDAFGYSQCGEDSGSTCAQSGRAALKCGSEDNCLSQGNQGTGGCVPAGRGLLDSDNFRYFSRTAMFSRSYLSGERVRRN